MFVFDMFLMCVPSATRWYENSVAVCQNCSQLPSTQKVHILLPQRILVMVY